VATAPKLGIVQHGQLDGLKSALARCRDAARDLPAEELPDLIGELEAIKATAWARLTAPALATQEHDELLDVETAAEPSLSGVPFHPSPGAQVAVFRPGRRQAHSPTKDLTFVRT